MRTEFVELVPSDLEEGVLYLSMIYATTVHLCACGCKNRVVAPLSRAEWTMSYNGDTVSLNPSIGNWDFPCRSHYWIKNGEVVWGRQWTKSEIREGKLRDLQDLEIYFAEKSAPGHESYPVVAKSAPRGFLRRLLESLKKSRQ